jgi:hypothetical protein
VGIITVLTRSASTGQVAFVIPLILIITHLWRVGIIERNTPLFIWILLIAGLGFAGWVLYMAFGAISRGVINGIDWNKYE